MFGKRVQQHVAQIGTVDLRSLKRASSGVSSCSSRVPSGSRSRRSWPSRRAIAWNWSIRTASRFTLRPAIDDTDDCAASERVEPHLLVLWGARWYLVAYDLTRDRWQIYRLDRITPQPPTGQRFTPRDVPGESVAEYVGLAALFGTFDADMSRRTPAELRDAATLLAQRYAAAADQIEPRTSRSSARP